MILEHRHRGGRHWDWLFEEPELPVGSDGSLWAARLPRSPRYWPAEPFALMITPLAAHRRRYLTYQGPLTRQRGIVRRIERGTVLPHRWHAGGGWLTLSLAGWCGQVVIDHRSPDRCRAVFYPDPPLASPHSTTLASRPEL